MRAPLFTIGVMSLLLTGTKSIAADSTQIILSSGVVLTNVAQIRNLTATQAAQGIPVLLRGVVVDESQPHEHALILSDQGACVYLLAATNLFARYHPRDLLVIKGVTSQGEFAPMVLATNVQYLGQATIPAARPATYQQLITGALDAQFVEITGVVRQCWPAQPGDDTWRIVLAADGGTIPVRIPVPQDPQIKEDAEVTIQAVCLYQFNNKRQALTPVLQVPRGASAHINKRAPDNPYAVPAQFADSLLQFSSEIPYGHRIHVHGVVTRSQSGSVWIRDKSSGLRIQTRQENSLLPGDEIDALGFPSYGSSTPVLEDAIYRKFGTANPPVPLMLTDPADAYDHQDDLIGIEVLLTDIQPVLDGIVLTLEHSNIVFKAILKFPLHPNTQPEWLPGSVVRVIGICDVIYGDSKPVMGVWHPQSFQILLRTPADLTIIKPPPWWTARHIIFLLAILAGVLLTVSGTVMLLARRRLNEQAQRRAMAEGEFAAILSERNRLAREIHDTLAQGFTATLLQLQLVKHYAACDHNSMGQHLDRAQQMIRDSLKEARNSIWKMRPQVLETSNLVSAMKNIMEQIAADIIFETHFEVVGRERRLSPDIENNILRLGQEVITNAAKHAQAKQILVKLEFGERYFSLTVVDDGRGFDPANPPPSEGGFGLIGMQERAKELNGCLKIRSAPNQGTEINLHIPLMGE